jgi:hypothetical protein
MTTRYRWRASNSSRGKIMSDFFLHKFGRNPDLNTAQDDVWDYGSNYQFPAVATSTQLVGLANDIPSSDGVHSVSVEGLLADGTEVTEVGRHAEWRDPCCADQFFLPNQQNGN